MGDCKVRQKFQLQLDCHTFGTRSVPRCYALRCCRKCASIKHNPLAMFAGRLVAKLQRSGKIDC